MGSFPTRLAYGKAHGGSDLIDNWWQGSQLTASPGEVVLGWTRKPAERAMGSERASRQHFSVVCAYGRRPASGFLPEFLPCPPSVIAT